MIRARGARSIAALLLPALCIAGSAGALAAQTPQDRAGLIAFRDSLHSTSDSAGLAKLEARMIVVAKADRDNAMQHLRLGFLAMRLGDLGSKSRFDDAAGEFQWATELQPSWPWGWFGLGLAEDAVGDSQISLVAGLQAMFGKDHLTRAANAYTKSVQVDPSFVEGLVQLSATTLRQRVNVKIDAAREALRVAAATSAAANPEVLLYRGRVEREVGDIDSAVVAFQGYLERGENKGLGQLELARTLFLQGTHDGQPAYYEGAASNDSTAVAEYRGDIAVIAPDSALAEFDALSGPNRAGFLHRFWGQRDRADLRKDGERLREHYRRIFYARQHFQLVSTNRHYDIIERYRSGSRDYDDRGIIYIRHGDPDQRATYARPGMELNESWLYVRSEGNMVFHFLAREDVQDFKLVESLFDVLGFEGATALRGTDVGLVANELLLSRQQISPIYSKMIGGGQAAGQQYMTEERALGRRSIQIGTTTDDYELVYPRELRAHTNVAVVGRDSVKSLLHVAYALSGSTLQGVPSPRGQVYPVRVRLSVSDRNHTTVATLDTTRLFVAKDPVPEREFLVSHFSVPVPPGFLTYRLAIEEADDRGLVLPPDTITAGDFSGNAFTLSGLVLGTSLARVFWRPAEQDTVYFNPVGSFKRTVPMDLYYEIYGLSAGAGYKTEVMVAKQGNGGILGVFSGKKPAIRLSFDDQSTGLISRVHRQVGLEKLSSGDYWMEIVVTAYNGSQQRSRAPFTVRE
jgi:GWxTD domain-containing protein